MVRVISVHHFSRQDVSRIPRPAAVAAANSHLVVATEKQTLEVRNLENPTVQHSFQTIDKVSSLVHSNVGDYLATLEGRSSVRAYVNWSDPSVDGAPVRPRIAGRVTSNQQSPDDSANVIDMIELPQRDAPLQIAVCPSTGNLLVGAVNLLIVYKFASRTPNGKAQRAPPVDFHECFHVFHNFIPKELALSEDVIGCLSDNEVHVFKVKFSNPEGGDLGNGGHRPALRSISMYSFSSESDTSSITSEQASAVRSPAAPSPPNITLRHQQDSELGEQHLEGFGGNVKRHPGHAFIGDSSVSRTVLPQIAEANRSLVAAGADASRSSGSATASPNIMDQTLGPSLPPVERQTTIKCLMNGGEAGHQGGGQSRDFEAECATLVHCKLLQSEEGHESFKNLTLRPVYWKEFKVRKRRNGGHSGRGRGNGGSLLGGAEGPPHHPLQSKDHAHLMSHTALFTSHNEGHLYHLPGHIRQPGRGCGVRKCATYPFTSPVSEVTLEPALMHALTETGLETYTLKSAGGHTVMEAEKLDGKTNACPTNFASEDEFPICLVGLRPFPGARRLTASRRHLVLISQNAETSEWTCYSLRMPTVPALHGDMMQLADMNRAVSPQGYFQLLCEAHIVARTAMHQLSWLEAKAADQAPPIGPESGGELSAARDKFRESCRRLSDYYVTSTDAGDYEKALPYFRMGGQTVSELLREVKGQSRISPGLLHILTQVVQSPTKEEGAQLSDATVADEVIDLLGTKSIESLAALVVNSAAFRGFKTSKMFQHFDRHLKSDSCGNPDPREALAFALLSVDVGGSGGAESVRDVLRRMKTAQFAGLLIEKHGFLLDEAGSGESFSDLAILVRDCLPQLFVEVLVSLIRGGVFSLTNILQLFLGSFVSSISNGGGSDAAQNSAILQLFLETYFVEFLNDDKVCNRPAEKLHSDQENALQTLVRSYLSSLSTPVRFGEKDIDADMFGTRHDYLDRLPPFCTSSSSSTSLTAKEMVQDAESPDFWCQNTLLKLQSLLCCTAIDMTGCRVTVLAFLDMYPDVVGSVSLRALSCSPADALPPLCSGHPEAVLAYARQQQRGRPWPMGVSEWQLLLSCLQEHLTASEEASLSHPMHEAWYSAMQEVLDHLAQTFNLEAFLEVLPRCGREGTEDFQGYIQMCRKNQQAADIQSLIVDTGHKLLSTLTL